MRKYLVFFAAIAATLSLAGSCSKGVDSVKTLVEENSGQTVGIIVEYNTPISYTSVTKKTFEVPGYWIISALTTEKDPEDQIDENKKKAQAEEKIKADDKIQVVPRKGQNLDGGEIIRGPQAAFKAGLKKDSIKGKDGKYVLLFVRKKRPRTATGDPADSTAAPKPPQEKVEAEKVIVRQALDIKTVKGKTVEAWKEGKESSETIKIKMSHYPGMPGGGRGVPRRGVPRK